MKKQLIILLLTLATAAALHAQRALRGTVTDPAGDPLPGASVRLKTGPDGAIADPNGQFSLRLPAGEQVITVSYTGFKTTEISVGPAENEVSITLEEAGTLAETVVTALNVAREERSIGYSVAQVSGEDLTRVRDVNIVNSLMGRAAGIMVVGSNGNFGSSARITIRGIKSINGNNQPLFVVDGVPMDNSNSPSKYISQGYGGGDNSPYDYGNAIQDLNPNDIENISVLKGQAAAALYGSRGVNGVIMVTTKKGRKGKGIGVTVNSGLVVDKLAVFPKFQNKYGGGVDLLPRGYSDNSGFYKTSLVSYNDDGSVSETFQSFDLVPIYAVDESNGTRFATSTQEHFDHIAGFSYDNGQAQYGFPNGYGTIEQNLHFRDWNSWDAWDTQNFGKSRLWEAGDDPSKFFETGISSIQSIAIESGGKSSAFRLSYTRFDQKGIYPDSWMNRNALSFNGSLNATERIQAFFGANYIKSATHGRAGTVYTNDGGSNPAQNFGQWWHTELRFADLKIYENPDGSMRTWNRQSADNPRPLYWDNPYWTRFKNYQNDGRDRFFGNTGLSFKINKWLTATGRVLTDFYTENREERIAEGSLLASQYSLTTFRIGETNTDLILRANHYFGGNLSLDAFVGGNKMWRKSDKDYGRTVGGLNVPGIYRIQNSRERPFVENTATRKQIESFFGGASFGWKSKLYLDLTGRQDWSSTLPDGANGYFYPSASLAWVFTEMMKSPAVSFGKLRVGWASVGGDTDPYNIYTTYTGSPNFGSSPSYTVPNTLNNQFLKPEKTNSLEAGAEVRFLKDRLGLDLTVYQSVTNDQIIPLSTSSASGFTNQFINAGEIRNRGIEVMLNTRPVEIGRFSWELGVNFGKNRNEVRELIADDPSVKSLPLGEVPFGGATIHAQIGQPFGTILGTNYLFDINGKRLTDADGHYLVSGVMPIGNITPDFTGGVVNTFSWKGLRLGCLIDFRKGGDIISTTNMWGRYSGLLAETAIGDERENGHLNDGSPAIFDAVKSPIQVGGADTETLEDDTYQSTGAANTVKANSAASRFNDGGYVINAADVYDGSYIKLREMSLGFSIPKSWLKRARIQDATFSLVGRNLAILFKNIPNIDPDTATQTGNVQGVEGGATPTTRSYGVNLNLRF